jgi:hypothetical protein
MKLDTLAFVSLALAFLPCALFFLNLRIYRRLPKAPGKATVPVSVLIPARNEESNIKTALAAVLANRDCEFEVIVLDDQSVDRTAEIVREMAADDPRVRLEFAPPLPGGWCGKQHACHVLSQLARYPLLVFLDADVRLAPDALGRVSNFMNQSGVSLASGFPRQKTHTISEKLLIPLIHFVLLGFLSLDAMRRSKSPAMSAGCGQLFAASRAAYNACGGHAAIRDTLHDGIRLPRNFRKAGFSTGLFDATDVAVCRMYRTNAETWAGLGKNATEGLAAPATILPATILLAGGQILPFVLLFFSASLSRIGFIAAGTAAALAFLPRWTAAWKFKQSVVSACLHPIGVASLLAIQWWAAIGKILGKPSQWKGRSYSHGASGGTARIA